MSVPLDRLYNFLHDACNHHDVIIYRFFPHGSRKISDLKRLGARSARRALSTRELICNDQEPLNYQLYSNSQTVEEIYEYQKNNAVDCCSYFASTSTTTLQERKERLASLNLRLVVANPVQNHCVLLLHSEKRSSNLELYEQNGFVGVYWWAHAMIARDWYRYANVDLSLDTSTVRTHDFLIYNRAWSGTREYRLKFIEQLLNQGLADSCNTKFSPEDSDLYYTNHVFSNPELQIHRQDFEQFFSLNTVDATASADYDSNDYCSTGIEIVLETLFDDNRLHLTEKSLRPIACGQPFMLAATHGSLEYLRSYGFETFGEWIDESYDTIENPVQRLEAIVQEMKRIANLSANEKDTLYANLKLIASRNKQLFFSQQWQDRIVLEFVDNVNAAIQNKKSFNFYFHS